MEEAWEKHHIQPRLKPLNKCETKVVNKSMNPEGIIELMNNKEEIRRPNEEKFATSMQVMHENIRGKPKGRRQKYK